MKKLIPGDAVLIPDEAEKVFQGKIFSVYQWQQELFNKSKTTYEMIKRPDTVVVIPIVGERLMTIEDSQPNRIMRQTFPGGKIDPEDVSVLDAAKREVKEETGYEFNNWRLVQVWQPEPKLEWFIHLFVATDGRKVSEPNLEAGEKIEIKMPSFDETKALVLAKVGYLGGSSEIFEKVNSLNQLMQLPEFKGQQVDR